MDPAPYRAYSNGLADDTVVEGVAAMAAAAPYLRMIGIRQSEPD